MQQQRRLGAWRAILWAYGANYRALLGILLAAVASHMFMRLVPDQPSFVQPLTDWSWCAVSHPTPEQLAQCTWQPCTLPFVPSPRNTEWYVFRSEFPGDARLTHQSLALLIPETAETTDVSLNGEREGLFNRGERDAEYLLPIIIPLPRDQWQPHNELRVAMYFPKRFAALAQGPVGLVDVDRARNYLRGQELRAIFFPFASAFGALSLAFCILMFAFERWNSDRLVRLSVAFCVTCAVCLLGHTRFYNMTLWRSLSFALAQLGDNALYALMLVFVAAWRPMHHPRMTLVRATLLACLAVNVALCLGAAVHPDASSVWFNLSWDILTGPVKLLQVAAFLLAAWCSWRQTAHPTHSSGTAFYLGLGACAAWDFLHIVGVLQAARGGALHYVAFPVCVAVTILMARHAAAKTAAISAKAMELQARAEQAAQIGHDIRSPLAALTVAAQRPVWESADRDIVRMAVARIQETCNNLLDHPKPATPAALLDVNGALHALASEATLRFDNRVRFVVVPTREGAFVAADPGRYQRAISNLINNAVEATPPSAPATVQLCVRVDASHVHVDILDSGPGFPAAVLARLGERGNTLGKANGHGLGLADAKETTEAWGGTLHITQRSPHGAQVCVSLPRQATPAWHTHEICLVRGASVLIVDDDPSIGRMWQRRITEIDHTASLRVRAFPSAQALSQYCDTPDYRPERDVIVLDFQFEGSSINGLMLIEALQLQNAYLVTSYTDDAEVQAMCQARQIPLLHKSRIASIVIRVAD